MKRFRILAHQSPAIIISLIALTFSLGSGAGYAASVAAQRPSAAKIEWHYLSLKKPWAPMPKAWDTGRPAYAVSNNVVYLTGAANRTNQSLPIPAIIGLLPRGARPAHILWFESYNYAAGGESSIEVEPNGDVVVWGTGGDENYFTSLAGVSFPLGS
jgi:hypothetical protein